MEATFRFVDITNYRNISCNYCDFTMRVSYTDNNIEYVFSYNYRDSGDQRANPFKQIDTKYIDNKDGITIHRNSLTEHLTEYLLMDSSELSTKTGTTTPLEYKLIILKTICELW